MNYNIFPRSTLILSLILLAGCEPSHLQTHPAASAITNSTNSTVQKENTSTPRLILKEPDGTESIANSDGSVTVLPAPSSTEDLLVGSETESGERSNADIIDNYGNPNLTNDKDYNFEALPPVTPQENGCSGLFCP
ncbi:MAG: hypothetical protein IBJ00_04080 [Alphaproteobacteria bacterium]|nr:hypothetical protein [Alphaproteobacteria bacterium]